MIEIVKQNEEKDVMLSRVTQELNDLQKSVKSQNQKEIKKDKILTEEQYNSLLDKSNLTDKEIKLVVKYANCSNLLELWLRNLRNITDKQIKEIIKYKWKLLNLSWINNLTDEQIKKLSKFKWWILCLDWLSNITPIQAKYLSNFKWTSLWLDWLERVTDQEMEELTKFEWHELRLDWLKEITDAQAVYLSESCRRLYIGGLKTITDIQFTQLIRSKRYEHLELSWLENLTESQFYLLTNFEWKRICLSESSLTEEQKIILKEKLGDKLILTWKHTNSHGTN